MPGVVFLVIYMVVNDVLKLRKYGVKIFYCLVKGAGIAILLLILAIAIGEGPPNPFKLTGRELLLMAFFLATLVGLALAVWRQLIGGIVILTGIAGFTIIGGMQETWLFYAFWLVGLLNILCWRLRKFEKKNIGAGKSLYNKCE